MKGPRVDPLGPFTCLRCWCQDLGGSAGEPRESDLSTDQSRAGVSGGALYLGAVAVSTVGSAVGALESTFISTTSSSSAGGLRTAIMLVELLVFSTLTVPLVPSLASRVGTRQLYVLTMLGTVVFWCAGGGAILAGLPAYLTMLIVTPLIGVTLGLTTVLSPLFARQYLGSGTMAGAYARLSVITGLSWGAGALLGGRYFDHVSSGYGILTRGLLALPLVVVIAVVQPIAGEVQRPSPRSSGVRGVLRDAFAVNDLRVVITLSSAVAVFALPYLSLIVPIAAALRQTPLASGAGLLMAGTSVGEIMSPLLVSRLQRRLSALPAAVAAAAGCAGCLLVFAAVSALTSDEAELALWVAIGIAFGALRYAVKSLELDAAVNSGVDSTEAVAVVSFAKSAVAPVGLLLWSVLMWGASVEFALLVAGVSLLVGCVYVWRMQGKVAGA